MKKFNFKYTLKNMMIVFNWLSYFVFASVILIILTSLVFYLIALISRTNSNFNVQTSNIQFILRTIFFAFGITASVLNFINIILMIKRLNDNWYKRQVYALKWILGALVIIIIFIITGYTNGTRQFLNFFIIIGFGVYVYFWNQIRKNLGDIITVNQDRI